MNAPAKYRKKPVTIEAMQLPDAYPPGVDPSSDDYARNGQALDVYDWLMNNRYPFLVGNALEPEMLRYPDQLISDDSRPDKGIYIDPATGDLMIRTLEGDMRATNGDWIIRGVQGEFYPCKPDIFGATYQAVEVEHKGTNDEEPLAPWERELIAKDDPENWHWVNDKHAEARLDRWSMRNDDGIWVLHHDDFIVTSGISPYWTGATDSENHRIDAVVYRVFMSFHTWRAIYDSWRTSTFAEKKPGTETTHVATVSFRLDLEGLADDLQAAADAVRDQMNESVQS